MPGDRVCCSPGTPYADPKPQPSADGTCATHDIQSGDTCQGLASRYGVSVANLERWNRGKTWAWTECSDMMAGYNMCVSDGAAPLPRPQQGAECGPLVPGTERAWARARERARGGSVSLADLNPCPLKACCSNWGYCGVFPAHCEVRAPEGGGPGSKRKGEQSSCIANCGQEIRRNSGPPPSFQRIGYYESFNLWRDCLWLKAKNANTNGSYTHIHWSFADIDPAGWKPVVRDPDGQWSDFKALPNVKRIVSLGGWAYSTEPATYHVLRSAIIDNREAFAAGLAQFVRDEGIDEVDIDWEYPGVRPWLCFLPAQAMCSTDSRYVANRKVDTGSGHTRTWPTHRPEARRHRVPQVPHGPQEQAPVRQVRFDCGAGIVLVSQGIPHRKDRQGRRLHRLHDLRPARPVGLWQRQRL